MGLLSRKELGSRPLQGRRIAVVQQMAGQGVSQGVAAAVAQAVSHLESLGAVVGEVRPTVLLQ